MKRLPRALAPTALALLLLVGAPGAADASPDDVANRVANNVMSPFCPGLTLHDCPSDASLELRERIVARAEAGWSYERIVAELETEYGEETIRATPPARGLGLVAWALPALALAAGGLIAFTRGRRWRKGSPTDPAGTQDMDGWGTTTSEPPSNEERARLEAELDELRGIR